MLQETSADLTGALRKNAMSAYHIARAKEEMTAAEKLQRGGETQIQRARRVVKQVLEVEAPETLQFQDSADSLGVPCLVFRLDYLHFRVRENDDFLSVLIGGQWKTVFGLAGLGRLIAYENRVRRETEIEDYRH